MSIELLSQPFDGDVMGYIRYIANKMNMTTSRAILGHTISDKAM